MTFLGFCISVVYMEKMNMFPTEVYTLTVLPGTRNHKGYFVDEDIYKLVRIESSGWAFICQQNSTCHYVDPDNIKELPSQD